MKNLLAKALVWLLDEMEVTVVSGVIAVGDVAAKHDTIIINDSKLNGDFVFNDGQRMELPEGRFSYRREAND